MNILRMKRMKTFINPKILEEIGKTWRLAVLALINIIPRLEA